MSIISQLSTINRHIRTLEKKYHRTHNSVALLAVTKKQPAEKIREAYNAGQHLFAENYVQEALSKQIALRDLNIEWHFIGNIQSNKTKLIAENFSWVHSVNRLSIAEKLNQYRESIKKILNVCIEVNIDEEKTKSGVLPNDVFELAKKITGLKYLKLRGLMIIPEKNNSKAFQKTFLLQQQLIQRGLSLDTLSMGLSADFEAAIAAGSTIVRIGTAIFGER
ncbi:MAG TPA: YggS family pyridoxal phosphate-dependent enzyme [Coxiellaceae bacterium]|nr:MAG: YggS family pyridoxal phosphate enzyme [Gammaproteobacteria bacterium RIFCSPHIGHO2_12_FULL_36_30]HLB55844.1 YggS family pyridoxal phosphate-dependent enzyme [Coxiellaceae bacterium]